MGLVLVEKIQGQLALESFSALSTAQPPLSCQGELQLECET